MANGSILHVGSDICQRIPVLTQAGYQVLRSEDSVQAISSYFADGDRFSAIVFQCDLAAPAESMVHAIRALSTAPFVLFQNPTVDCEDSGFDLAVPVLTPPDIWLKKLKDLVEESGRLRE
jgi:hypothetical protein